ncbi:MAG: twin arginine-targeting protein translocase TatC [Nitrospirae bacterium RBG_13_43_8]|nr:MAG: twin arginine-targeting protein translocase TatC [Nitrospirae bacterium RBG_13_43_8]
MQEIKLPFTEHLVDLRKRIIICLVFVVIGFAVAFNYSEDIFRFLTFPLKYGISISLTSPYVQLIEKKATQNTSLIFLAPAEAFWMHMKISIITGVIFSLPVIFSQIWKFIAPGLLHKEKKYVIPFVSITTTFFLLGAAYCFFLVLPFAMGFLLTYKTESMTPMISVEKYVDFCVKFILAFGAIFELPVLIVFFTRMGFVTPKTLAKHRKYAILIAFVVAAILTPTPDIFNQTLMAVPIIVLYEIGILVSRIFVRKKPA